MKTGTGKAHLAKSDILIVRDYYAKHLKKMTTHMVVAGSIRRGVAAPGDIDFLVIPNAKWDTRKLPCDELEWAGEKKIGLRYAGVHIDIMLVQKSYWGSALLYFTGSGVFNILMRKRAIAMGYKLNEYGLFDVRDGICAARLSEAQIFTTLKLKMIPPELRTDKVHLSEWLMSPVRKGVRV